MTKIFEALENAGLERSDLRRSEASTGSYNKQVDDSLPVPAVKTIKSDTIFTSLYQNIAMALPGATGRIVQFLGTRKGEGATTLVRELAETAAFQLNKSVLLLDADKNKPNQVSFFNVRSKWSFEDIARNGKPFKAMFPQIKQTSLYVTDIPTNGNSASLVRELPRIETLLSALRLEFDLILLDSPAATCCEECLALTSNVDGVVLVVEAEKTRWQAVERVKERIMAQEGKILGVILNKRRYPIPDFIYNKI